MPLTSKERSALWRQRQRENPELYERYKAKERVRNQKRKEHGDCGRKSINDMTEREQRKKRKEWRQAQRDKRASDKLRANRLPETPPTSPPTEMNNANGRINVNPRRGETMRRNGKKKKKRDRAKAYRKIEKLQIALFDQRRLVNKWKKRCERLKNVRKTDLEKRVDVLIKNGDVRKVLLLGQSITDRVRDRYHNSKSNQEKRLISSLVCAYKVIKRYRIGLHARRYLDKCARKRNNSTTMGRPTKKTPRTKELVLEFLNRDDNSRIKAGKKATITRKGEKRQIRLLSYDLKTLHSKFLSEKSCKISYSLFCQFKPFNVLKPSAKDRDTCLCRTCENMTLKLEKCHQEKALPDKEIEKVLETVTCDIENKECMYRECTVCKDKEVEFDQSIDLGKPVSWFDWKTKRVEKEKKVNGKTVTTSVNVTTKEKESGSLMVLMDEVTAGIQRIAKHIFNIRHQYRSLRSLRETLAPEELIVHMDFPENYNCKYASEIQSMHFGSSQKQISLHTGVAYTMDKTLSFCTVTDCLKHSPASIWAHLHPVLEMLQRETHATIVHFISDGPTTQYRNKQNFFLLATKIFQYGFKSATWNFLEAGHGKGAADGIGAVVKRTADSFVNNGGDIRGAGDLLKALESKGTTVQLFGITEENVEEMEDVFPLSLKPIPRTMQIHQMMVSSPGTISHRAISCFCSRPNFCSCFGPESAYFLVQSDSIHEEVEENISPATPDDIAKLEPLSEVDESLISRYCVKKYDGRAFPGIILSVDEEEEVEVQTMHRIGRNKFFWPMIDDTIWYAKEMVVTLLQDPPQTSYKKAHGSRPGYLGTSREGRRFLKGLS